MNLDSCKMIPQPDEDAVIEGPAGSFCIETLAEAQRIMWVKLPDGSASLLRLRPIISGDEHPSWELSGTDKKPSLEPSVLLPDRWHGWIRAGRMESC